MWSLNVLTHSPFLPKSQILADPSADEVASKFPLGWNSTPDIQSVCPSPPIRYLPSGMFHNFHVLSSLTVARMDFLGCMAIFEMPSEWALNDFCNVILSRARNWSICEFNYGFSRSFGNSVSFFSGLAAFFSDF